MRICPEFTHLKTSPLAKPCRYLAWYVLNQRTAVYICFVLLLFGISNQLVKPGLCVEKTALELNRNFFVFLLQHNTARHQVAELQSYVYSGVTLLALWYGKH